MLLPQQIYSLYTRQRGLQWPQTLAWKVQTSLPRSALQWAYSKNTFNTVAFYPAPGLTLWMLWVLQTRPGSEAQRCHPSPWCSIERGLKFLRGCARVWQPSSHSRPARGSARGNDMASSRSPEPLGGVEEHPAVTRFRQYLRIQTVSGRDSKPDYGKFLVVNNLVRFTYLKVPESMSYVQLGQRDLYRV